MLVGESPGGTELSEGIPFVGGAGMVLDTMLNRVGIRRSECFITNVCHVQPPKNEFKWFTGAGQMHLIQGIMQLKKDIAEVQPNLIIALGSNPLKILTGKDGITAWRGSLLPGTLVKGTKVMGTYHPAAILRQWDYKCVAEFDLIRAKEESLTNIITYPERTLYLPTPVGTCITRREGTEWVDYHDPVPREPLVMEMLEAESLAVDIECTKDHNGTWRLSCVGFSDRPDRALVIACDGPSSMHAIRILCGGPNKKVLQNGMFDYTVLEDNGIRLVNFDYDTMYAHHCLFAEASSGDDEIAQLTGKKRSAALAKGLAFQTSIYTKEPYYKADGKLWHDTGEVRVFYRYNALDCCCTKEIQGVQLREMSEFGVTDLFRESYMDLVPYILRATRTGIRIDVEKRKAMKTEVQAKIDNLQKFVDGAAGGSLNAKSPKQMTAFLYETLKLPHRHNKAGNLTADKDTLVELGNKTNNPVLHAIIKLRQNRDLVERYLNAPLGADMRMRCSFDPSGTRSGRLSSRASLDGSGTNLQNQPEEMRKMFVADPGCSFVYRDYSQAEARLVAYQSRCKGLVELFEDPTRDVHTENAARIFGHSVAVRQKNGGSVTETERYLAKKTVHACNYGMAAPRLVEVVNEDSATTGVRITLQQARQLIDKYFMLYPEIQQNFWREVESELKHTRILNTPFGRKRMFFARWDDKLLREAYSYVPQSTIGDLGRIAWVRIASALDEQPRFGGIVLLQVHDSILVQCKTEHVREVAALMEREMDIEMTLGQYKFRVPTDCKVGLNWGNQADDNPDGLVEMKGW